MANKINLTALDQVIISGADTDLTANSLVGTGVDGKVVTIPTGGGNVSIEGTHVIIDYRQIDETFGAEKIRPITILGFNALPQEGDVLHIENESGTEDYTFTASPSVAFDVQIGVDAATTLTNLQTTIGANSAYYGAFLDNAIITDMLIFRISGAIGEDRIWAEFATSSTPYTFPLDGTDPASYANITLTPTELPSVVPIYTNFGHYSDSVLPFDRYYTFDGLWHYVFAGTLYSETVVAQKVFYKSFNYAFSDIAPAPVPSVGFTFENSLPEGCTIEYITLRKVSTWSGTGITDVTLEVGNSGDADKFVPATSIFTAAGDDTDLINTVNNYLCYGINNQNLSMTLRTTGGNVDALTAGEVEVVYKYSIL